MKILTVFGTRPEAIKMAPLVHSLEQHSDFEQLVCVTAQHRQMLDQVLRVFNIVPDIDLNLMQPGQDLCDSTSSVLTAMRDVLRQHKPDAILVHGDTTTAMSSALAAFYLCIPVGHIEAGFRTHDLGAPFPEEFNRQIIGKIAKWHFAPTNLNAENLIKEGIKKSNISITGNTIIDAMLLILKKLDSDLLKKEEILRNLILLLDFNIKSSRYILITGHRRENFGEGFLNICNAIQILAQNFKSIHFVYPVHMNPKVQQTVHNILDNLPNVHLIHPLDYESFILLLSNCYLVLTDSGGIQEEAPSLGKPVLVMRDVTERPEAVHAGTVKLVGANTGKIVNEVTRLLINSEIYQKMAFSHNPYGDGRACEIILNKLKQ